MAVRVLILDPRNTCRPETDLILNTVRYVDYERVEPVVVCRHKTSLCRHLRSVTGLEVIPLPLPETDHVDGGGWPRGMVRRVRAAARLARSLRALVRIVRERRIQVIYAAQDPLAMKLLLVLRRFVKVPYVLHCHDRFDGTRLAYQAARHAAAVIANTQYTASSWRGLLEDDNAVEVLYDGALLPKPGADRDLLRWQLGLAADAVCVTIVGQAHRPGWVENFFEFAPEIVDNSPQCQFVFADTEESPGHAERARTVRNLAAQYRLGGKVHVVPVGEDFARLACLSDLVVLPIWTADAPMQILESMGHKTPVLGVVAGGLPEMLQNASGFLLPPRDFVNLADAIIQLAESPTLGHSLAERGYQRLLEVFHLSRYLPEWSTVVRYAAETAEAAPAGHGTGASSEEQVAVP